MPYLPEKASYIGWSFGGLLAIALASTYPERVHRIINIASTPRFIEDDNWPGIAKPGLYEAIIPSIQKNGLSHFLDAFVDAEFEPFDQKPAAYHTFSQRYYDDATTDLAAIGQRIKLVDQTDLREAFQSIQCPIDHIFGTKDAAIPNEAHHQILALNPNAKKHVIENAQHMMFWTHQTEFNQVLTSLVDIN